jgi:hypothetical protein
MEWQGPPSRGRHDGPLILKVQRSSNFFASSAVLAARRQWQRSVNGPHLSTHLRVMGNSVVHTEGDFRASRALSKQNRWRTHDEPC